VQVLKDEIRNKILHVAEDMFYQNGFRDTTTRRIAEKTGIRVSNLYLYYENKEAIFCGVTDSFYHYFLNALEIFFNHADRNGQINADISPFLQKIINADHKKFVILTDKSQGTKYEDFKQQIILQLHRHMKSQVKKEFSDNDLLLCVLAKNLFEGIVEISKNYQGEDWLKINIDILLHYHIRGMEYLL